MIIKYKDIEINFTEHYKTLRYIKDNYPLYLKQFFNILIENIDFKEWFYKRYDDLDDFRKHPNICVICKSKCKNKFCKKCFNSSSYNEYTKRIKLERYGSENYNNRDKMKKTKLERYGNETFTNIEKQKQTIASKSDEEKLKIKEKLSLSQKSKSKEQKDEIQKKKEKTKLEKYGSKTYNNRKKAKQTNLEKYGSENYNNIEKQKLTFQNKSQEEIQAIKEKRVKTNLEKYGSEYGFQSEIVKDKIKQTKLERYSNENYNNSTKTKKTKLERYGDENYNNYEKANQTNLIKYGFKRPAQSSEIKEKIKLNYVNKSTSEKCKINKKRELTNLKKYGVLYSRQQHLTNFNDLNSVFIRKKFIKDGWFLISDFMKYFNIEYTQTIIYKQKFNISEPNKTELYKTQKYIFDSIKTENKIFNGRSILDGKELDIYLPDIKLAIEYNGLMYHSEGYSEHKQFGNVDKNYHLNKTNQCLDLGIQLFHIFEGENLDLWLSMINNKLGLNERIFARKCKIRELSNKDIFNFLSENHIQGYVQSKINLGLFYTDGVDLPKLVSVMTFSKPRFNKRYEYELIRFCSLKNTSVIGGANKLLKYFIRKYNPKSIISYANRRFSNGSIYETLGFKKIGASAPNYFYFKDSTELESRNKYQKHKLKSLLSDFDPNLSEAENMFKNGYRRIYDCGNLVYELIL